MSEPDVTPSPTSPGLERAREVGDLIALINSGWRSRAVFSFVDLGLPDALAEGARSVVELADATEAHAPSLRRLLRALASLDLCRETAAGVFELTRAGSMLRSDAPDSLVSAVGLQRRSLAGWERLADCVRAGVHAVVLEGGPDDPYAGVARDAATREAFDRAMLEGTRQMAPAIALAYDFSDVSSLVDVGGGYGALLPPLLRRHSELRATVFDFPACRDGALRVFEKTGIADRCAFVAGDFFRDPLPPGADAYVLKAILHGFDDARCVEILESCRRAMAPGGRVLLVELVVPERLGPGFEDEASAYADLNMLVSTGGVERTESEYATLLERAGLRLERVVPTLATVAVVEGRSG